MNSSKRIPRETTTAATGSTPDAQGRAVAIVTVSEPLEQDALAAIIRRIAPDAEINAFRTLAAARNWIEGGGRPELAIVQAEALGGFGGAAVRMWKHAAPGVALALYAAPDAELGRRALASGFDAVFSRAAEPDEFAAALGFVLAGNRYVSPAFVLPQAERGPGCAFLGACGWAMPLLDELPIGLFVLQGERVIYHNRYMTEHFGYSLDELRSMAFWEPVVEPHKDQVREAALSWRRGDPVTPHFLTPVRARDGSLRWAESFHRVISIGGGPAVVVACVDATARMTTMDQTITAAKTPAELAAGTYVLGDVQGIAIGIGGERAPLAPEAAAGLTDRHRQVLALLAIGSSNKDIGAKLGISEATVKLHVHHIMRALGVSNRTAAALMARRLGG